mgnify:CR=1 FL=1
MGGYPGGIERPTEPDWQDRIAAWLANVGMAQAISQSPNPADVIDRIERMRMLQGIRQDQEEEEIRRWRGERPLPPPPGSQERGIRGPF